MPPAAKDKDNLTAQAEQITTAIFSTPEIDTAASLFARSGATLESELRKVFSGEQLGFTNAQAHTRTRVEAHTYRCGLIIGVQPGRAGALLDGADGGTPQRFIWLPMIDPDIPDKPPALPDQFKITQPIFKGDDLEVPEAARKAIDDHQVLMHRGQVDPLDGHTLLVRLKVAAALMVLHGRDEKPTINDEDWHLAGIVMEMSDRTRGWVQRERAETARRNNRGRALATAERDEIITDRKLIRCKEDILRWLHKLPEGQHTSRRDLMRKIKNDIREYFDTAVSELIDEGKILEIPLDRGTGYVAGTSVRPSTSQSTCEDAGTTYDVPKYVVNGDSEIDQGKHIDPTPQPDTHPNDSTDQSEPSQLTIKNNAVSQAEAEQATPKPSPIPRRSQTRTQRPWKQLADGKFVSKCLICGKLVHSEWEDTHPECLQRAKAKSAS